MNTLKSRPTMSKEKEKRVCNLCLGPFKASEEVLLCEGSCGQFMHRYCARITKKHYELLSRKSLPFVCLVCTQQLHKAEVQSLKAELEALKSELAKLQENVVVTAAPSSTSTPAMFSAELQALREDVEMVKTKMTSPSYANVVVARGNKNSPQVAQQRKTKQNPRSRDNHSQRLRNPRPKEKIDGSRKIWGTLKSATDTTVKATLVKLTTIANGEFETKRKYKELSGKVKWWFVLKGSEEVMEKFDNEWEKVSLQTSWKIEPLLKYSETTPSKVTISQGTQEQPADHEPLSASSSNSNNSFQSTHDPIPSTKM